MRTIFLILLLSSPAFGQSNGQELQAMIDEACQKARDRNKTYTVVVSEEPLKFDTPIKIWSHVKVTTASGAKRSARWIYTGEQTSEPLVSFTGNTTGAGLAGVDIRCQNPLSGVHALMTYGGVKNATFENITFAYWGTDCVGMWIKGHESIVMRGCEFRCSVPLVIEGGDNHHFQDMDLGAGTDKQNLDEVYDTLPQVCVWLKGMPHQWTFDGYQTWQGGQSALYGEIHSEISGECLSVSNLRYEQSTARDTNIPAVYLKFTNRHLERLHIESTRWTDRERGLYARGVWNVERISSFLPGTFWWTKNN